MRKSALLFAAVALVGTIVAAQSYQVSTLIGKAAPAWTLKDPSGKEISLASLRGKVVVMDFWATWCGPCRLTMPAIEAVHKAYKDKGVVIVGINSWERNPQDAVKYMKDNGYTYALALDGDMVAADYKVEGIPTLVVVDKKGVVRRAEVGYKQSLQADLSRVLDSLLRE
jgi:thiol-disulfide isomerase/thioredoxin